MWRCNLVEADCYNSICDTIGSTLSIVGLYEVHTHTSVHFQYLVDSPDFYIVI